MDSIERDDSTIFSIAARRHPLIHRLASNLHARCGASEGARIVLGVSGGADSLALAIGAAVLARRREIDPMVVHVHHHLRPDADDDAHHVESVCRRLGLAVEVRDVHPACAGGNLSSAARDARYLALADAARESGAPFVAVAHHADDQFETILMALCRGSEAALAGMRWARPLTHCDQSVMLIRPLLDVSRQDCEALCEAAGVQWRMDPSNTDRSRARARLRAEVIPILENLWPGAAGRAVGSIQSMAEARQIIDDLLLNHFGPPAQPAWPREALAQLPPALLSAGLRRAALTILNQHGADDLSRPHLDEVALAIRDQIRRPRRFALIGGLAVIVKAHEVTLSKEEEH